MLDPPWLVSPAETDLPATAVSTIPSPSDPMSAIARPSSSPGTVGTGTPETCLLRSSSVPSWLVGPVGPSWLVGPVGPSWLVGPVGPSWQDQ